jgi:hypothetical protein
VTARHEEYKRGVINKMIREIKAIKKTAMKEVML